MNNSVASLRFENVRVFTNLLIDSGYGELGYIYFSTVCVIEAIISLVIKEMISTRSDMIYWKRQLRSGSWEQAFKRMNRSFFNLLFSSNTTEVTLQNENEIEHHILILKSDYDELSLLLAIVNDAANYLKRPYESMQDLNLFSRANSNEAINQLYDTLIPLIQIDIQCCLNILTHFFQPSFANLSVFFKTKSIEVIKILNYSTSSSTSTSTTIPSIEDLYETYDKLNSSFQKILDDGLFKNKVFFSLKNFLKLYIYLYCFPLLCLFFQ
jgi:hypothetical protein